MLGMASVGLFGAAAPSWAQSKAPGSALAPPATIAPADCAGTPQAGAPGVLPDNGAIVVTAQRRSEFQRDVPISITTLNAAQIAQANVNQLTDITKVTPGVRFDYATIGFAQPTIRGIGTSFATPGGGSNVGIYVDGFYSPNPLVGNMQLLNVQSIQILKGPQGTLFGRNTTGGAVIVTTVQPSTEARATAEISYGSYNAQRYQAYVTAGLTDKIAVDAQGLYRKGDGFIRNVLTGRRDGKYEDWSARVGIKVDWTDTITTLLRYQHDDNDDPTAVAEGVFSQNGIIYSTGNIDPTALTATGRKEVSNDGRTSLHNKSNAVQLTNTLDLDFATLISYTQYRRDNSSQYLDTEHSSDPIFHLQLPVVDRTITQEMLMTSKPGTRLQWTAGLFYFDYKDAFPATASSSGGGPYVQFASSGSDTRSIAAFLDGTYEVVHNLFVTGGMRYSHDEVTDGYFHNLPGPETSVPPLKGDRVTPRAVIRYKPSEQTSLYASFTRGYKPGILNVGGGTLVGIRIAPEHISAWEAGFKYGDGRLSLDLAGYYYDYKDLQVSSYTGTATLITNAATSRIYGVEAALNYKLGGGFELNGGLSHLNAKYESFPTAPRYDQCLDPVACGAGYGLFVISSNDASGNQMLRSPTWSGDAALRYTTDLAGGRLSLSATGSVTSSFYFDPSNQFRQKGYTTLGLRAEWTDSSDRYTMAVFCDNVTDTRYRVQGDYGLFGVGSIWGNPATVGGSIRVRM